MIDKSSTRTTYKRCPTCGSRVSIAAATCPICGHEFAPQPQQPQQPNPAAPVEMPVIRSKPKFSIAQLPWGVFGVAAVIIVLVVGALLLLRNTPSNVPLAPTLAVTPSRQVAAVATAAAAHTQTPTTQAQPTNTSLPPTQTSIPATSTPVPPAEYVVQQGDTCGDIATKYDVPLSEFLSLNQLTEDPCLIRVGDKVLIPAATATVGPSPTAQPGATQPEATQPSSGTSQPTATLPPQIIVQVKSGDTCSDIASKYRITVDTLIQQNGLTADCSLQIGQVLTLTFAVPTPVVSPTPIIAQTPTPRTGYDAPLVISPEDGAQITDTEDVVTLQWLSVGVLKDDEWYVVQVQATDAITVPVFEVKATSLKLTRDIFGDKTEQSFAWWVQVKQLVSVNAQTGERTYHNLSGPSIVHRFVWRRPITTVTPTPNQ